LSENLKAEVFKTLDSLILFGDIINLFTIKFTEAEIQMINTTISLEGEDLDKEKGEE